jgi:hypothetical protein
MINNFNIMPLSGKGQTINCIRYERGWRVTWGGTPITITDAIISDILNNYFQEIKWYPLGASMTEPISGGLGEYLQLNHPPLTPRHASAIAAIMVQVGLLKFRGIKPIDFEKSRIISE